MTTTTNAAQAITDNNTAAEITATAGQATTKEVNDCAAWVQRYTAAHPVTDETNIQEWIARAIISAYHAGRTAAQG